MASIILLSLVNTTILGLQPLQSQSFPLNPVPNIPCSANSAPLETSLSLLNGTTPFVVCRNPDILYTQWNGNGWVRPSPLPIPRGNNLRTTADLNGRWWVNLVQPPTGGTNGLSRSLIYAFPDGRAILNTTDVAITDIQWSPTGFYFQGTTTGVGLFRTGVARLDAASSVGYSWLTLRLNPIQTFVAPKALFNPLYIFSFGSTPILEIWDFNRTSSLWTLSNQTALQRITLGTVVRAYIVDSTMWIITTRMLGNYSLSAGNEQVLTTIPPTLSYVSGVPATFLLPPSPSTRPIPTASASPSSTATGTATMTPTGTPSATGTATMTPTGTPSATGTATMTPKGTPSVTGTATMTPTGTPSVTGTATMTPKGTPSVTGTATATGTATPINSMGPTNSQTATPTPTVSPSISPSNSTVLTPTGLTDGAKAAIGVVVSAAFLGAIGFAVYKSAAVIQYFRPPKVPPQTNKNPAAGLQSSRAAMLKQMQQSGVFMNRGVRVDNMRLQNVVVQDFGSRPKAQFHPVHVHQNIN